MIASAAALVSSPPMLARLGVPFVSCLALAACGGSSPAGDTAATSSGSGDVGSGGSTTAATGSGTTAAGSSSSGAADSTGDGGPCGTTAQSLAACVDAQRYADDLAFVTGERTPGSPHWQQVQDLCADRLAELGYEVDRFEYATGVDVVGRRAGTAMPEQIVMVGAHYDHIGGCAGADDNGTGVAATLEVARVLATVELPRTVVIACWDEEESGLVGSTAFAEQAASQGLDIVGYVNFEMIGYRTEEPDSQQIPTGLDLAFPNAYAQVEADGFRGNFIALIANAGAVPLASDFAAQAELDELRTVLIDPPAGTETSDLFADLRRSDHAAFWDAGYAALLVTDTAEFRNPHYHCAGGPDEIADLDQDFAVAITRASVAAAAMAAGL